MYKMNSVVKEVCKLSHKQFRALLKKFRRKKKRQLLAQKRDEEELLEQQRLKNSPRHKDLEDDRRRNAQLYEEFEEKERLRQHKLWLYREQQAQIQFRKKKEQVELEKQQREEERKKILEEFEKQQSIENEKAEINLKIKSQKEEVYQEAIANLPEGDGPWHNPYVNDCKAQDGGLESVLENAVQEGSQCMFYEKTGCCRFGERCSKGHMRPTVSTTILIKGMFAHFSIDHMGRDDYDSDMALEYEDKETYNAFKSFYSDVLPEFKNYGKVVQFKVCCNHEPHLRGNVYIQYSTENEAVEAYNNMNGRYYAGKQISCEYSNVIKWRSAICGLYFRKQCPKGIHCNFLHVFRNPNDEFWDADRDVQPREVSHRHYHARSNSERYSNDHRPNRWDSYRDSRRDNHSPDSYRDSHHSHSSRKRSPDSESDSENRSYESSRSSRRTEYSHRRHKYRKSRSKSRSPSYENSRNHKKKSKKKKKKKSKRSSEEDSN